MTTFAEINSNKNSVTKIVPALWGDNLRYPTVKLCLSVRDFIDMSLVANLKTIQKRMDLTKDDLAQRELNEPHARALGFYTLSSMAQWQARELWPDPTKMPKEIKKITMELTRPSYAALQPIVANIRNCDFRGGDLLVDNIVKENGEALPGVLELPLGPKQELFVIDGQHRRVGFKMMLDFLDEICSGWRYPIKGMFIPRNYVDGSYMSQDEFNLWEAVRGVALMQATIAVEVHLGLNTEQEQQLFHDLNNLGRRVPKGLALSFDQSDPVGRIVRDELPGVMPFAPVTSDTAANDGVLLLKDVHTITSLAVIGKSSSKRSVEADVNLRHEFAKNFWKTVSSVKGFGTTEGKAKTVLQQPVVLKALAKLANDLGYGHTNIRNEEALRKVYGAIKSGKLDFSHTNPVWQALFLDAEQREKRHPGISKYIHVSKDYTLDAGEVTSDGLVLFGSRHNDIFPRIGDLIRYQLELKPRPSVTRAIAKEAEKQKKAA